MRLKITFTLLFSLFLNFLFAQKKEEKAPNYDKVDAYVKTIPFVKTIQIDTLALYLSMGANKPRDKARAIYDWVSSNITYDNTLLDSLTSPWANVDVIRSQQPDYILISRKAICEGYADLYKALADRMGLRAEVVVGAVKDQNGEVPRIGHAWNVVKIATDWELIDVTWGANKNGVIDEKYFFSPPENMILDHLPFDPMWQLTANPLPLTEFKNADDKTVKKIFTKSPKNEFVFRDTISRYFRLDTLMRLYKSSDRMLRFNANNEYVTFEVGKANYFRFVQMSDKLNLKLGNALENKNIDMDSTRFEGKIAAKWSYYQKALDCYKQIKDDVFQEKFKKGVYSPRQIEGLKKYDRGLYYATIFTSKRTSNSKSENGLSELEKYTDYSFKNFKSAITSFDTLAETKFRPQTYVALLFQMQLKKELIEDYILFASDFLDDIEYMPKNKKKVKNALLSSEQHYKDAVALIDRQAKMDTTSSFKKDFQLVKILIDYANIEYDIQLDFIESSSLTTISLTDLDKREKINNNLNTRIIDIKKDIKEYTLEQKQENYLNNVKNAEMSNDFCIARNWFLRSQLEPNISNEKIRLYLSNGEYYLSEGEKIFKNVKGQNEVFYRTNEKFIDTYKLFIKNKRAELK